ncbi:MAG TPA: class I SAM-dependent methyltransferase [Ferruginibacter sp.]|nr:class I SAM-dependent methyltransferase [Ferruginibacter sp.]
METDEIREYYSHEIEKSRLNLEIFKLEGIRTKEIISRYLVKEKLRILDIGGGAGFYAFWLREKGHDVSLVDLSSKNIELVKEHSKSNGIPLTSVEEGNATHLNFNENQFDLVLLLGPLYHLTGKEDRKKALSEAKRVLKPGGILLSAIISRYASLFDGFKRDLITDKLFEKMLKKDLECGIHINETDNLEFFTTAYFHTPADINEEIKESGLQFRDLIAVESFGWVMDNFSIKWDDPSYMEKLLYFIKEVESKEDLIAMSPHIIAVAEKYSNP